MSPFRSYRGSEDPSPFIGVLKKMSFHAGQMQGANGGVQRLRQTTPDGEVTLMRVGDLEFVDIVSSPASPWTFEFYFKHPDGAMLAFTDLGISVGNFQIYEKIGKVYIRQTVFDGWNWEFGNPLKIKVRDLKARYKIFIPYVGSTVVHSYDIGYIWNEVKTGVDISSIVPGKYNVKTRYIDGRGATLDQQYQYTAIEDWRKVSEGGSIPDAYYDSYFVDLDSNLTYQFTPYNILWLHYYRVFGKWLEDNPGSGGGAG